MVWTSTTLCNFLHLCIVGYSFPTKGWYDKRVKSCDHFSIGDQFSSLTGWECNCYIELQWCYIGITSYKVCLWTATFVHKIFRCLCILKLLLYFRVSPSKTPVRPRAPRSAMRWSILYTALKLFLFVCLLISILIDTGTSSTVLSRIYELVTVRYL